MPRLESVDLVIVRLAPTMTSKLGTLDPEGWIILAMSVLNGEGQQCPEHREDDSCLSRFLAVDDLLNMATFEASHRQFTESSDKPLGAVSPRPLGFGC